MRTSSTHFDDVTPLPTTLPAEASWIVVAAGMACVISIQFGYTVHLSIGSACFALACIYTIKRLTPLWLGVGLLGVVLVVIPHLFSPDDFAVDALYRSLREAACFFVLVVLKTVTLNFSFESQARIARAIWILMIALLVMSALQAIDLKYSRSELFFVPYAFFAPPSTPGGCWTIAACWLQFEQAHGILTVIRPSATYSEPSYLGFIVLCLVFVSQNVLKGRHGGGKMAFIAAAMATVLLAQTTSGIISIVIMLLFATRPSPAKTAGIILAALLFATGAGVVMSDRVSDIMRGTDMSFLARFTYPFQAVSQVLEKGYVLGVPSESLAKLVSNEVLAATDLSAGASDNGLINMFLLYGICGGIALLAILFLRCSFPEIVFLVLSMQFNGSIFTYDKATLISLSLILFKARFDANSGRRSLSLEDEPVDGIPYLRAVPSRLTKPIKDVAATP